MEGATCENCGAREICDRCRGVAPEPALWLVLKEADARALVGAVENGQAHKVVSILKEQEWWDEITAAVRGLRHLHPNQYNREFPKI